MANSQNQESTALLTIDSSDANKLTEIALERVRDEVKSSPYIQEALKVLTVGGYRSAIGCFWNAVVDDLRNKIIYRSLELFNKSVNVGRLIKSYEDFQNHVSDDELIEGAYKTGVIGWEASKILKHAKETRHIFDGHPASSQPSLIKVFAMMEDCVKYVLALPYPPKIIDIDEYLRQMAVDNFDRNEVSIEIAVSELPEIYQVELINRLFTEYVDPNASTIFRSNVEFAAPYLWQILPVGTKQQVARRVDQEIKNGNADKTKQAFAFIKIVGGNQHLPIAGRKYLLGPVIERLNKNLDNWDVENECIRELEPLAAFIPQDLLPAYVRGLVMSYVGVIGSSPRFNRTDFYADGAAIRIPGMIAAFDENAAASFVEVIRKNPVLRSRIAYPAKMQRLRTLGNLVLERVSPNFSDRTFLEALIDENRIDEFYKNI